MSGASREMGRKNLRKKVGLTWQMVIGGLEDWIKKATTEIENKEKMIGKQRMEMVSLEVSFLHPELCSLESMVEMWGKINCAMHEA